MDDSMTLPLFFFTAVPAIYIVVSTALLFVRNSRALRALERFAPASKGAGWSGWGHADVEVGGMPCRIEWATFMRGRAASRWTRFRFQVASTESLTITPHEWRLAERLRELVSRPKTDLGDDALRGKFTFYADSKAFARSVLTPEARSVLLALEPLGPLLVVSPTEVRLDIEANPITPGAPLLPDQLVRVLEDGHRLALAVARAGSSDAPSDDSAPTAREVYARPKETGRVLMLVALLTLLGVVVLVTLSPGVFAGSGGHMIPAAPDPPPAKHR